MEDKQTSETPAMQRSVFDRILVAKIISTLTLARFSFATPVAELLAAKLEEWLTIGFSGALVYAWFRLGKTCGCRYALNALPDFLGFHVGFMEVDARQGLPSERDEFFLYLLESTKNRHALEVRRMTQVRKALVDFIVIEALKCPLRTFIMFIDEAQMLIEDQCLWLRELDNDVSKEGCRLFLLYEGDNRVPELKDFLIAEGREQYVARSMADDFVYRGLLTEQELSETLHNLVALECEPGTGYCISAIFKSVGGIELAIPELSSLMWKEFSRLWQKDGLGALELPMAYVCMAAADLFRGFAKKGWSQQPSPDQVSAAIAKSFPICVKIRKLHQTNPPSKIPYAAITADRSRPRVRRGAAAQ